MDKKLLQQSCSFKLARPLLALLMLLALAGATGCVSKIDYRYSETQEEKLLAQVLGPPTEGTSDIPILALNDAIRADLDSRIDSTWTEKNKLRELRSYLFSADELGILYDASATKSAIETYETKRGNCLALTNLFIAAARYVGLDAHFQTVVVRPTWDHAEETMIRYEHIVATGNLPGENYVVDFLPEFVIGNQPTTRISDRQALALFYNNLGAEAVVAYDLERAITYLRKALQINPKSADTWNNMGAGQRRAGRLDLAEFSYLTALRYDRYNYSALGNLAQLYNANGRSDDAREISERVERYRRRNPYFHYFIARVFFKEGRYDDAITFLKNSIRLKKDEPDFYEALAMSYSQVGNDEAKAEQLALAEKYRDASAPPPAPMERTMSHRIWVRKTM